MLREYPFPHPPTTLPHCIDQIFTRPLQKRQKTLFAMLKTIKIALIAVSKTACGVKKANLAPQPTAGRCHLENFAV